MESYDDVIRSLHGKHWLRKEDREYAYIEVSDDDTITLSRFLYWSGEQPPITLSFIMGFGAWAFATPEERERVARYFDIPELRVRFAKGIDYWKKGSIPGIKGLILEKYVDDDGEEYSYLAKH